MLKARAALGFYSACNIAAGAQPAEAQTGPTKWGESGNREILIDPDVGDGCYMKTTFDEKAHVRLGGWVRQGL